MIAFINDHREAYGIEPICKVLPIAPSIYHDHVAKRLDPSRLSDRAKRDEALKIELRRVFEENFRVYGARKVWRQLRREGFTIARCTVERLIGGVRREATEASRGPGISEHATGLRRRACAYLRRNCHANPIRWLADGFAGSNPT